MMNIELYDRLIIEVEYSICPEQKESWGYRGGDPHIPEHVEEVGVTEIIKGDLCDLCEYINDQNGNFFKELEAQIMKEREEFDG